LLINNCVVPEVDLSLCGDTLLVDVGQIVHIDSNIKNCEVPDIGRLDNSCDISICQSPQADHTSTLLKYVSNDFQDSSTTNCEMQDTSTVSPSNGITEHRALIQDNSRATVLQSSEERLISCVECGYSGM